MFSPHRTFSCHRPRTKDSGSPVRTAPAPAPPPAPAQTPNTEPPLVVRVDSNFRFTVVDMLNPEARHQFARNCPERSTVAVPGMHRPGFTAKRPGLEVTGTAAAADKADSVSSASTASRADTLDGSSANTLESDATHKRLNTPQTPKKIPADEFILPSAAVTAAIENKVSLAEDSRTPPRMNLPAAITTTAPATTTSHTSSVARDPMTQWSMRLRVAGPPDKPRTGDAQPTVTPAPGQTSSTVPSDNVASTICSTAPTTNDGGIPVLTTAKPYTSTPTKPGQFFRRITSRLSRSHTHGRADEVNKRDEDAIETRSASGHPTATFYTGATQSAGSESPHTGLRLATTTAVDASRTTESAGELPTTNPVDPWTTRQRQRHRPKSSSAAAKHATIAIPSDTRETESHSSGTDARNGYQGESADDATLTARENEPFIPRLQESRSGRLSSVLTGSLGRRRPPYPDSGPLGGTASMSVSTSASSPRASKPSKPRRLHFVYRLPVIGRDPNSLMNETERVLNQNGISFVHRNEFCLSCTNPTHPSKQTTGLPDSVLIATTGASAAASATGGEEEERLINSEPQNAAVQLQWEVEVCRLGKPSRYGVKFKRISGDPDAFKQLEQTLTRQFNLNLA